MKYIYHRTELPRIVEDDYELPEGWAYTPAAFGIITAPSLEQLEKAAEHASETAPETREDLLALAEQRGITVDRRWGVEKLRAALNGNADST